MMNVKEKTKLLAFSPKGSLDLEVSQRALFLCNEQLALKESQLSEVETRSSVLGDE